MVKAAAVGDNCIDSYKNLNKNYPGGSPVNFAVYMKELGVDTSYIGVIGDDDNGKIIVNEVKGRGVDVSRLHTKPGKTAVTQIELINKNRVFTAYDEGVFEHFTLDEDDISFIKTHHLVHSDINGRTEGYYHIFKEADIITSFDFSNQLKEEIVNPMLPYVDYAFFSYDRYDSFIENYIIKAQMLGSKVVVATLGENGSIAFDGRKLYKQDIYKVDVVDTLGAGDSFIAGFMYGILNNKSVECCLDLGAKTAAKTISYFGAW